MPPKTERELAWERLQALGEKALKSIEDAALSQKLVKEEVARLFEDAENIAEQAKKSVQETEKRANKIFWVFMGGLGLLGGLCGGLLYVFLQRRFRVIAR